MKLRLTLYVLECTAERCLISVKFFLQPNLLHKALYLFTYTTTCCTVNQSKLPNWNTHVLTDLVQSNIIVWEKARSARSCFRAKSSLVGNRFPLQFLDLLCNTPWGEPSTCQPTETSWFLEQIYCKSLFESEMQCVQKENVCCRDSRKAVSKKKP